MEKMPMWCPPTPPQDDSDLYIDYSLCFLYEQEIMPENELPPVYVKKETKRTRSEAGFFMDGRRPIKMRKEDNYFPPRSLFDRPSPALAKLRRDLKLQRYRGNFKPMIQLSSLKQPPTVQPQITPKPLVEPEGMPEWMIYEDMALLNIIQNMQGLPLSLMLLSPGHTPNWDLVADVVNQTSRAHRTPKQCRYRYEAVIVPREEGKLIENPKKQQKKNKANPLKNSPPPKASRALRSVQLFTNDNNASFTKLMRSNFEFVKTAFLKKPPQCKPRLVNPSMKNPKHVEVLSSHGVVDFDMPMSPLEIAARRAEKIKERNRNLPNTVSQQNPPELVQHQQQQQQQQQQQHQQQQHQQIQPMSPQITSASNANQQQATTFVVQQPGGGVTQVLPAVASIVQAAGMQAARTATVNIAAQQQAVQAQQQQVQQQPQIVKAIVAASHSSNMLGAQHVSIVSQGQQAQQIQQIHTQGGTIVSQSPVSMVLTTPVSTIPNIQSQIVSIHQGVIPSSSTVISQAGGTLVQAITTQSAVTSQVVSVAQFSAANAIFTTASLPSNATVATLTASGLRQRIVTNPGSLQEMVFTPRSGSQSPTVVSVSGLAGQTVTQGQLQAGQLRLSVGGGQQVSGVVTKNAIAAKPISQPTQIQFLRQNPQRQQFKVVNTAQGNTILQPVGGQVSVVNQAGGIIQGGLVSTVGGTVGQTLQLHQATGQKVSIATVSGVTANAAGIVSNVGSLATPVQLATATGQAQRTHFVKQVGGKQTIARAVNETEMLLVKRQMLNQTQGQLQQLQQSQSPGQQKTQYIQQLSPAIQLQQAGASGQQHIAALVKTSSGTGTAMTLTQLKPGQIKATIPNANAMRQMQLQQIPMQQQQQQRKSGKMTQVTGVTKSTIGTAQLIVQNPKNLQTGTVTMQQIVLGKGGMGRIIPVSGQSQPNARQTIQVVSAASAQGLPGAIRTHMATTNMGTFKIAPGTTPQQTQAIFNAIQQQQIRQNAAAGQNLRLQTSGGSQIVAVSVQQPTPQQHAQIQQAQAVAANQVTVVAAPASASIAGESAVVSSAAVLQQVSHSGQQQQLLQQQQQQQQQQSQPATMQQQTSAQVNNQPSIS